MKVEIKFGYGKEKIPVEIPDKNLACVLNANPYEVTESAEELIRRALDNPIGTPRLSEIVKKGETVAIITSDITRPMPSAVVLPQLLEELNRCGIPDKDVEIVFGVGSHRGHSEAEMRYMVGDAVFERIRCSDANSGKYVYVGETPANKTPVAAYENVLNADRRICLGNVEYHYFAGYSGGSKAIMPGVCSRESIQPNHRHMVMDCARAGNLDGNFVREDIEAAADMVGIDFILNVILDENKKIAGAVAGDRIAAHRAGAKILDALYKIEIQERADIVLVSPGGYPKDINLYQAQKALDNAKHAVKDGGIIIWMGSCKEGLGEGVFERWIREAKESRELVERVKTNFELGGHKAAAIAMVLEKARIFLVSDLEPEIARSVFLEPYPSAPAALEAALATLGSDSRIIAMPYGGATLPVLA